MPIPVRCPGCSTALNAPDAAIGRAVRCPKCRTAVPVPAPAAGGGGRTAAAGTARTVRSGPGGAAAAGTARTARPGGQAPAGRTGRAAPRRPARRSSLLPILALAGGAGVLAVGAWLLFGGAPVPPPGPDAVAARATGGASAPAPADARPDPAAGAAPLPAVAATGTAVRPPAARVVEERILLAGSAGQTAFHGALALSDGSLLVCGGTDDLGWTGSARRIAFAAGGLPRPGGQRIGFVLHLEGDLSAIRAVWHFPKGASGDIRRLRSTEVPGNPTGDLYLSGDQATFGPGAKDDGYWIARLDANGVARAPAGPLWVLPVQAGGRQAGGDGYQGDGDYKLAQPWDVAGDGRVAYVTGAPYDFAWAAMELAGADGRPLTLAALPWQRNPGSGIVLKAGNPGSLRSTTQADFDHRQEDENGHPGRKGRWPDDYYFKAPLPERSGRGYTGYRISDKPTQRIGKIAFDRRDNHLYFGYSTQTRLPDGNPDFEPAIVAFDGEGRLKWWARGYREIERTGDAKDKHQDAINSPPDQYIEGVAVDYANDRLLVVGRCHGNGVVNFWRSQEVAVRDGREGFQRQFTGTHGNAHYSWLGRYTLADGRIRGATYVGDLGDYLKISKRFPEGHPLAGWPTPNDGWHNLQSTRLADIEADVHGRPVIAGTGKRSWTTGDARIPNLIPTGGGDPPAAWCPFVRVYDADLGAIAYGSIVRGPWNQGQDPGHSIALGAVIPLADGLLTVGTHTSKGGGSTLPTTGVPGWAAAQAPGAVSGVIAVLRVKSP